MNKQTIRHWAVIGGAVLILDWILGVLCAADLVPHWVFVVCNIPFGALYVAVEASWAGTRYEMLGLTFGEIGSAVVFLLTVALQSLVYLGAYERLRRRQRSGVAGA